MAFFNHKCEKVCAWTYDEIWNASGGIFSELAFDQGGAVSHILTNDREKLVDIRSSKYSLSFSLK